MKKLNKIISDIKSVKIQGATNVAVAGVKAYSLKPAKSLKNKLIRLRPTEPALFNSLNFLESNKMSKSEILLHFKTSQEKISLQTLKIIKPKSVIFTHCHSNTVVNALVYARKKGKKFKVYNTETRPLYQGRKTARQLSKEKIDVTNFVDSAMHDIVKKSNIILLGADAILRSGVINKIGSTAIAEIAHRHKKPAYILSDSWKFYPKKIRIEERDFKEVWRKAPKNIKVRNPAFEKIPKKYIKAIISEYGTLPYTDFIKKADKII